MKTTYDSIFKKTIANAGLLEKYINFLFTLYSFWIILVILFLAIPPGYFLIFFLRPKDETMIWGFIFRKCTLLIISLVGLRIKIKGAENIPQKGPVIFAINHISHIDAIVINALLDIPMFAMIMPAVKFPFVYRFWLRKGGCVEVTRDRTEEKKYPQINRPQEAYKLCLSQIAKGNSLLIFPEGHIERAEKLLYFHTGTARLALEAKMPIIPIIIQGANRTLPMRSMILDPKNQIILHFAKALELKKYYGQQDNHQIVRKITWFIEEEVLQKLPKKYIGVDIIKKISRNLASEKHLDRRKIRCQDLAVLRVANYKIVEIRTALEKIGWYPKRHSKVLIKPDLSISSNQKSQATDVRIVKRLVDDLSLSDCQIYIGVTVHEKLKIHFTQLIKTGGYNLFSQYTNVKLIDFDQEKPKKVKLGKIEFRIPEVFDRVDYYINIPKLKISKPNFLFGAMTNQFSILSRKSQKYLNQFNQDEIIAKLAKILQPHLVIVDAIEPYQLLIAGKNLAEVDNLLAYLTRIQPQTINYFWQAKKIGLSEINQQQLEHFADFRVSANFSP